MQLFLNKTLRSKVGNITSDQPSAPFTSPREGVKTHFVCLLLQPFSTATTTCSALFPCTLEGCVVYVNSHWRIIAMLPECCLTCRYGLRAVTLKSHSREHHQKLNHTNRLDWIAGFISDWAEAGNENTRTCFFQEMFYNDFTSDGT